MSLHIYIPTFRRVHSQTTLQRIPKDWKKRTTLVAVKEEADSLRRIYGVDVLVQPKEVTTITAKRQWIVEQCDHDKLVMLDDDLRMCVRKNGMKSTQYSKGGGDVALVQADFSSQSQFFGELEDQLDDYAHAGCSMRMGNQSRLPGWHENKRMCYVLAYQTEIVRRFADFSEIRHREDMLVTLRLLDAGYANTVSFMWAADQVYNKSGGESAAGRSMEASSKDALKLARMYPHLVKAVEKAYKVSVPRVEVVVQWNKAFNGSLS
jgi:hypothetical protein